MLESNPNGFLKKELNNTRLFVGLSGAEVTCVDSDGEIRWELGFTAGRYYAEELTAYMEPADRVLVNGGQLVKPGGKSVGRLQPMTFGEKSTDSGANPTWVAPERSLDERLKLLTRSVVRAAEKKAEKRLDAMVAAAERKYQKSQPETVIEEENTDGNETTTQGEDKVEQKPETKTEKVQVPEVKTDG